MIGINKGFTLVELIVVIAALLLVLGTAVGIFISIVQHQRIILAEQELLNQFSYAIDHMSKALRMAGKDAEGACMISMGENSNYELTLPDATTGVYTGIKFINQSDNDACQEFFVDEGILKERKNGSTEGVPLTSNKFYINSLRFGINGSNGCSSGVGCVEGASEADIAQSRVTIYLDIQISGNTDRPSKKIQTTISQRNINVSQ